MCGINEFSLFPELEHKLSYIKNSYVVRHNPGEEYVENEIDSNDNKQKGKNKRIRYTKIKEVYKSLGKEKEANDLIEYIKEFSKEVDWDLKDSIRSKIKLKIKSDLKDIEINSDIEKIVNEIIAIIYNS